MARRSSSEPISDRRLLEETFGQVLREKRLALGLRMIDLETDDGIGRSHIGKIESADSQICLRGLFQVAEGLEITPEELIADVRRRYEARRQKL